MHRAARLAAGRSTTRPDEAAQPSARRGAMNEVGGSSLASGMELNVLAPNNSAHAARTNAGLPTRSKAAANSGPTRTAAFSK